VVNGSAVHQGSRSEQSTFTFKYTNKHTSPPTNKFIFTHTKKINNCSEQVEGQQGPEADQPTQEVVEVVE